MVSDHTIASLIKYPDKLYPYQEKKYFPILKKAIEQDRIHFATLGFDWPDRKRTRLRLKRDMIAESTDWYVTQVHLHACSASTAPYHAIVGNDVDNVDRIKNALAQYYQPDQDQDQDER